MSGTAHGSIEHLFAGAGQGTGSVQAAFVNLYNFFNNNTGTLGIQRIAYHTGSKNTGMADSRGMGYYDAANPAGDNAWACFCFSSASAPWYVLIQYTGSSNTFGSTPGSPGLFKGSAQNNVLGLSFASRADFGNPWNGSSGSNGRDTKGTPVWHPGTSSLALAPRSNDAIRAGAHGSSKQNTLGFAININTTYRQSMVADYDNFALLMDSAATNNYGACILGMYTPLTGLNPNVPWAVYQENALPFSVASAYGDTAGTSAPQGGIGYTNLAISGSCISGLDRYTSTGFFQNTLAQPNRAFATPTYDEFPLMVGIFESPSQIGMTGQFYNFFREAYNVASHDTNATGDRAAFGGTTLAAVKLTIPWHTGTVPGSGATRAGTQF